jgi:Holliday junction resolvase RusA-like endonuclease
MAFRWTTTLHIDPIAKGRPRFTRIGHAFTPKRTRDYEKMVKEMCLSAWNGEPLSGPVVLTVDFTIARPKTNKTTYHSQKPDCDNLLKAIQDSLNGVAFNDDSQIVCTSSSKKWGDSGLVEIIVESYDDCF